MSSENYLQALRRTAGTDESGRRAEISYRTLLSKIKQAGLPRRRDLAASALASLKPSNAANHQLKN